jgi:putative flippase GtrA|tara:strand:- start:399 stop:770 length:372 start_codon:yes stop_codon:yes gene_type:complete
MFQNLKKFIKYGINGIINTAITYPSFIFLSNIIDYVYAICIIYPLGILLSYFLNKKFVFNQYQGNIIIFFIVMITMFFTNISITWILVEFLNIGKEISQGIAIGVVFILSYLLNKKISFKKFI